jgi:hypothetical protein
MKHVWQQPIPKFGGGGGSSGGGGGGGNYGTNGTGSKTPAIHDPWTAGMFGPITQQAQAYFPQVAGVTPGTSVPQPGPQYMPMQQLYGQGGPLQGIGAAIAGMPQHFQAPAVNPFGQFYLKGVQ